MKKFVLFTLLSAALVGCNNNSSSLSNESSFIESSSSLSSVDSSFSEEILSENIWKEEDQNVFLSYLHTTNIPSFDKENYLLETDFFESHQTMYVISEVSNESDIKNYEKKLLSSGYRFYKENYTDGRNIYLYEVDENTVLEATPSLLERGNFILELYLRDKNPIENFDDNGMWKTDELNLFYDSFNTYKIPYIDIGPYYIDTSDYNYLGCISLVFPSMSNSINIYKNGLEDNGIVNFMDMFYLMTVNDHFTLTFEPVIEGEDLVVDITLLVTLTQSATFPEAKANAYVKNTKVTIPALHNALEYDFFYNLSHGGSMTITAYGDSNTLYESYKNTLTQAKFKIEESKIYLDYFTALSENELVSINVYKNKDENNDKIKIIISQK